MTARKTISMTARQQHCCQQLYTAVSNHSSIQQYSIESNTINFYSESNAEKCNFDRNKGKINTEISTKNRISDSNIDSNTNDCCTARTYSHVCQQEEGRTLIINCQDCAVKAKNKAQNCLLKKRATNEDSFGDKDSLFTRHVGCPYWSVLFSGFREIVWRASKYYGAIVYSHNYDAFSPQTDDTSGTGSHCSSTASLCESAVANSSSSSCDSNLQRPKSRCATSGTRAPSTTAPDALTKTRPPCPRGHAHRAKLLPDWPTLALWGAIIILLYTGELVIILSIQVK